MIKNLRFIPRYFSTRKLSLSLFSFLVFNATQAGNFYVNDNSLAGDVFTTAIGDDLNAGTSSAPFATVQFAIGVAALGDTIYVDAGTYVSGDINITKSLTFRGAKFGIPAGPTAVPVNRGTNETIIQGSMYYGQTIDNISIDGFTIDMGNTLRGIEARGLNSVIINNIVTGTLTPFVQQAGILTRANAPNRLQSYIISYNNVVGLRYGIYMDGNTESPSEISYNYVSNSFTAGFVLTASNGHHLKANVSVNNGQGLLCTKGNNLIEQNTFSGNAAIGIRLAGTALTFGNNIINNFISGNGTGIGLTDDNAAATNNQANYNSITGNVIAIGSVHTADFNASCNWYGTVVPASIAALITGPVTFNPFLSDGTDTDLATDGFQPITTCIVAPVVLTDFAAFVKNYDVLLKWETASEVNSSYFGIERSIDNLTFTNLANVQARGFSNTKLNYNFTDNKPVNFDKPTYYRIALVDRDGSKTYSKTIKVILKTNDSFVQSVYPNPVQVGKVLHTNFISAGIQDVNLSFINATGQILKQYKFQAIKGANDFAMTIPADAASGVNFLLIRSADDVKKVPVYIQ